MQYTENLGCFPWGKRAAIVQRYPAFFFFPCVQFFRVSISPAVRHNSFTTDGYGIFNVRTNLVHTKGPQAQISLHKSCLKGTYRKNCSSPCPTRGSNPGSLGLTSDSLSSEPRPPSKRVVVLCCFLL